jgi:hypothetical protein
MGRRRGWNWPRMPWRCRWRLYVPAADGLGQAATIRVGYHYGARDRAAMGRAGWAAHRSAWALPASVRARWCWRRVCCCRPMSTWTRRNAAMVALALRYLVVAAAFQLVDARRPVWRARCAVCRIRALPMTIALLGYWLPGFGGGGAGSGPGVARAWRVGRAGHRAGGGGGAAADGAGTGARLWDWYCPAPKNFIRCRLDALGPAPISGAGTLQVGVPRSIST